MKLDKECRTCLFNSQMKKVEKEQTDELKLEKFKAEVKVICETAPDDFCAPLLMRAIDEKHCEIFGAGIDYSREKSMFNRLLLNMEGELYSRIISSPDPIEEALKLSMASNYIDFARLSSLDEKSVDTVFSAAARANVDKATLSSFKNRLKNSKTLCVLHDNCGEIVLDKLLIRAVKNAFPHISVISVVRGKPIINDVTLFDAEEVKLNEVAEVIGNGTNIPGTYLKEISPQVLKLLKSNGVILSKGLGNLETLYGEGFGIFYAFNCKCEHISKRFNLPLWSPAFIEET